MGCGRRPANHGWRAGHAVLRHRSSLCTVRRLLRLTKCRLTRSPLPRSPPRWEQARRLGRPAAAPHSSICTRARTGSARSPTLSRRAPLMIWVKMTQWHTCDMKQAFRTAAIWLAITLYGCDLRGRAARLAGLEPATGCLEENHGPRSNQRIPSSEAYRRGRSPPPSEAAQVVRGTYVARNRA